MKIESPAFTYGSMIPARYTCDGKNISPALVFSDIPENARSLVLIVDDPDVPAAVRRDQNWDHWIVFNIPPEIRRIEEGTAPPGVSGSGTDGRFSYGGPCPPPQFEPRCHRYFFKLYALDSRLDLAEGATKIDIEAKMNGRVIDQAELVGVYERTL